MVNGAEDMNRGGHSAEVRIYQLNNTTRFNSAEFEQFWQDDEALLADELIPGTRQRLSLFPEQQVPITLELVDDTRYVGFAANLRSPDGDRWRKIYSIEELEDHGVMVWIRDNHLNVEMPSR